MHQYISDIKLIRIFIIRLCSSRLLPKLMDSSIASPIVLMRMAVILWDAWRSLSSEATDNYTILSTTVSQILVKAINDADFLELSRTHQGGWSWEGPFEFFCSSAHCQQNVLMAAISDKLMRNSPGDKAGWTCQVLLPLIPRLDKSWFEDSQHTTQWRRQVCEATITMSIEGCAHGGVKDGYVSLVVKAMLASDCSDLMATL